MIGIIKFFEDIIKSSEFSEVKLKLAEPFKDIEYPTIIDEKIRKSNPVFAIALGEALKKFEK